MQKSARKIFLILSNPCIRDPRVEFQAKVLSKMGFAVEILAWDRLEEAKLAEERDGYLIRRFYIRSGYNLGIKQTFKIFLFYKSVYNYLIKQDNYEVIHCNDLDTLPVGILLKFFKRKKVVYDAHEIYSEMIFKNSFVRGLCNFIEKTFIKYVELFFTVGNIRREWYLKHKYPKTPVVLGNWKEKKELTIDPIKERRNLGIDKNKIIILYIGALNKERNLLDLIDAVNKDDRYFLIIGGYGTQEKVIKEKMGKSDNVKYLGFVKDERKIDRYNALSDVIYYGLNKEFLISKTAVPNKMFEAIAYDKLFLCTKTGEMEFINRTNDAFIFIDDLGKNLEDIYDLLHNKERREELSRKNKFLYDLFNKEKAIKVMKDNYLKIIQ